MFLLRCKQILCCKGLRASDLHLAARKITNFNLATRHIFLKKYQFQYFNFFCSAHHCDQMSEESQVSKVTICVEILKWQSGTQGRYTGSSRKNDKSNPVFRGTNFNKSSVFSAVLDQELAANSSSRAPRSMTITRWHP